MSKITLIDGEYIITSDGIEHYGLYKSPRQINPHSFEVDGHYIKFDRYKFNTKTLVWKLRIQSDDIILYGTILIAAIYGLFFR